MQAAISLRQVQHIEPLLVRYALRAVRREDLAQDLVQETWAAALVSLPQFQGRSTLRTWMVGILRRKIVDHRRRHRETTSFVDEYHATQSPRAPEQRLDAEAAMHALRDHLRTLPRLERHAVELCDVADMPRADAARQLGVSDGHLRVLLHRGRKRLRRELRQAGFAAPAG